MAKMDRAKTGLLMTIFVLLSGLLLIGLPSQNASAAVIKTGTCGEGMTWTLTDNGVLTISGTGVVQESTWPSSGVNEVVMQTGVTGIGEYAFFSMNMKSVVIPFTVKSIEDGAFQGCDFLRSISFPSGLETIGFCAFSHCDLLKKVSISDTVRNISSNAFTCCPSFTEITVSSGNSWYSAENGILYNKEKTKLLLCPPLATSGALSVRQGVTEIGDNAFWQCNGIVSVQLPQSLTKIGTDAFHYCENMTQINIPDAVTAINKCAFMGCSALQAIEISSGVKKIGEWAFQFCYSVKSYTVNEENTYFSSKDGVLFSKRKTTLIKYPSAKTDVSYQIPNEVQVLESEAFERCLSLQSISIPQNLEKLHTIEDRNRTLGKQFSGLENLKEFIVDSGNTAFVAEDGVLFTKSMKKLLYCPCGKKGTYSIPSGVTIIGGNAFCYNSSINEVIIPDGLETIEHDAFYANRALKRVTIPDSVMSIGDYAFGNCHSLTDVYYGGTEKEWANISFGEWNHALLEAVLHPIAPTFSLPKNLVRIESEAFANLKNAVIRIPTSVTYIADNAFGKDVILLCKQGSYAETRCVALGLKVKTE